MKWFCLLLGFPMMSWAGIKVTTEVYSDEKTKTPVLQELFIQGDNVRVNFPKGQSGYFYFQGKTKTTFVVNTKEKNYIKIDAQRLQMVKAQLEAVKAQLKDMPPAARMRMEKAMGGLENLKMTYVAKGNGKVRQWSCKRFEGKSSKQKLAEFCVVPFSKIGISEKDVEPLKKLSESLSSLTQTQGQHWDKFFKKGFPVQVVHFDDGGKRSGKTELKKVEKRKFAKSLFSIPKGFQESAMPMGSGKSPGAPIRVK